MLSSHSESSRNRIKLKISLPFHAWQSLPGGQSDRKYATIIPISKILSFFSVILAGRHIVARVHALTIEFARAVGRRDVGVITLSASALRSKIKRKRRIKQRSTQL